MEDFYLQTDKHINEKRISERLPQRSEIAPSMFLIFSHDSAFISEFLNISGNGAKT